MKKKVIIVLTTATSIVGVYVGLDKLGVLGGKEEELNYEENVEMNEMLITEQGSQVIGTTESGIAEDTVELPKEVRYLTTQELERLKNSRNPFDTAPSVEQEQERKQKEYEALMKKIENRINTLNKLEEDKKKKQENYQTNQKEFDEKVYEEIERILKGLNTSVTTNISVESQTTDEQIIKFVDKYATDYKVDKDLVLAIIGEKTVADAKLTLKNHDGTYTKGLMQISEGTAKWLAKKLGIVYKKDMEYDVETNIKLGTYYLNQLSRINSDEHYMATAYYMGPGGAERYYKTNKTYVSTFSSIIQKRK